MESAVKSRVKDDDPATVTELVLDGNRIKQLASAEEGALLLQFPLLMSLCMNQTGLQSLEHFPSLPSVRTLELSDNCLGGNPEAWAALSGWSALVELTLCGNRLKTVEELRPLVGLENLTTLDLELNPVAAEQGYRTKVFEMLPQVRSVDGYDRSGKETDGYESEDSGESSEADDQLLTDFYEKDLPEEDDEEDGDDYDPVAGEAAAEEAEDEEEDWEAEEQEGDDADTKSGAKRAADDDEVLEGEGCPKRPKTEEGCPKRPKTEE